jgi:hypothetical protein
MLKLLHRHQHHDAEDSSGIFKNGNRRKRLSLFLSPIITGNTPVTASAASSSVSALTKSCGRLSTIGRDACYNK